MQYNGYVGGLNWSCDNGHENELRGKNVQLAEDGSFIDMEVGGTWAACFRWCESRATEEDQERMRTQATKTARPMMGEQVAGIGVKLYQQLGELLGQTEIIANWLQQECREYETLSRLYKKLTGEYPVAEAALAEVYGMASAAFARIQDSTKMQGAEEGLIAFMEAQQFSLDISIAKEMFASEPMSKQTTREYERCEDCGWFKFGIHASNCAVRVSREKLMSEYKESMFRTHYRKQEVG